jgi:ribosome-associated protein
LGIKKTAAINTPEPVLLNDIIIDSIQDIKGKNITLLDLRGISGAPADFFIVCEGDSHVQVSAIAGNIYKRLNEELHTRPLCIEGKSKSNWVLVDYFSTVVHVFYPEARSFYNLEGLWNDAVVTAIDNI